MAQMMSVKDRIGGVRQLLLSRRSEIEAALPKHLTADRMLRVALTCVTKTPALAQCDQASLYGAVLACSQLGLEPDGVLGHAYLIPYGKSATLIVGYRGLMDLARRSGQVSTIFAEAVHEHDEFDVRLGDDPGITHKPLLTGDRGALVGVYAVCRLKDGGVQTAWMSKAEVDRIRSRSMAANSGPWKTDYEEMAKKTVLRRMCKYLPVSVEMQRAVALDERAELGLPQSLEPLEELAEAEVTEIRKDEPEPAAISPEDNPFDPAFQETAR